MLVVLVERCGCGVDASSPWREHLFADLPRGRLQHEQDLASVVGVTFALHEPSPLEPVDEFGGGRGRQSEGARQLADADILARRLVQRPQSGEIGNPQAQSFVGLLPDRRGDPKQRPGHLLQLR